MLKQRNLADLFLMIFMTGVECLTATDDIPTQAKTRRHPEELERGGQDGGPCRAASAGIAGHPEKRELESTECIALVPQGRGSRIFLEPSNGQGRRDGFKGDHSELFPPWTMLAVKNSLRIVPGLAICLTLAVARFVPYRAVRDRGETSDG